MQETQYKILTIEDEAFIRQSIRTYLEDYGFAVIEAENGRQGIEVFYSQRPDLVILDLRMPEMDGLKVLEILSRDAPDIPLVVASGTGNMTSVVQALRLGAWDYIFKPIEDMNVLRHSIDTCLEKSQLKKENRAYQEQLEELVRERTQALAQSEERYRAVFEYTGTAAIIIEADDTISTANSRFADLAGMNRAGIQGEKKWYEFVSARDIDLMRNYLRSGDKAGGDAQAAFQFEVKFVSCDGEPRYVYVSLGRIPGTDRQVASFLDVSEKKRAEQRWRGLEKQLRKSQKMEAIGTLAGGIAHDLNNILSPILGYADMIMKSADHNSQVFRRSEKIQKAALRAADLVSQVLAFNRDGNEEKRLIRIHPVAREVLKLLRGSLPATIRIEEQINRNCASVLADPTQIHQVIMNLCTNAYHAMEETGGKLMVRLDQADVAQADLVEYPNLVKDAGTYLLLEVTDTGCGMTEEVIERIFDPYFTTKEEGKGTGLGLATVYSIIQSCKGDIRVRSTPGKGTCFTILLPAVRTGLGRDSRASGPDSRGVGTGEHLLVVDDDPDIAAMLKEGFELLGYRVTAFSSSLRALDFFKDHVSQVDLVVSDQTMPEMTGIELAREMMAIQQNLPVILCSGYAASIDKSVITRAGIKKFIMKPVTVETLSREIRQLLAAGPGLRN